MYILLGQLAEFRLEGLKLLAEMSKGGLVTLSMEVNPLAVASYFNFMLCYAKIHLLLGACLNDNGKLIMATFGHAHRIGHRGEPRGFKQIAEYVLEFEKPLPKLQEDFANHVGLRLTEALQPLHMQLMKLSDATYLRGEGILSPVFAPKEGAKTARAASS